MRRLIVEEPISRAALWSRRTAVFALATAGVAVALSRFGGGAAATAALTIFGAALALAFFAVLLAGAAAAVIWRTGRRGADQAALGLALSSGAAGLPRLSHRHGAAAAGDRRRDDRSRLAAVVHDLGQGARGARRPRAAAPNRRNRRAAERRLSRSAAVVVDLEPAQAYQLALRVADDLGWRIVDANPPNLRVDGVAQIEALDRSLLFGFVDDIAIRIRPLASQTRIDVRSISRVGKHDFGANARRIGRFPAAVQEAMQQP